VSSAVLFLAVTASVIAWWLSHQRLTAKPWLEEGPAGVFPDTGALSIPAAKLGLWVFLAVAGSLFALLVSAYSMQVSTTSWRPLPAPKLLLVNTGMLAISSAALQVAHISVRRGQVEGTRAGVLAGGVSALVFLAGQLLVWRQLDDAGYFVATSPAMAFFCLLTGLHALHLLGGMVALGMTGARVWRGHGVAPMRLSVELCATYWHFLLVVWLILVSLLTRWAGDFVVICHTLLG
jgi:cytochrome c oxidase subunit III